MSPDATFEKREIGRLHLIERYQQGVSDELRKLAEPHAESSDIMELLPDDPEAYPDQKITNVFHDSTPSSVETITSLATASNPQFPTMVETLLDLEAKHGELSRIHEDLAAGGNLIIATNHSDIRDVAEVLCAFNVALRTSGNSVGDEADFKTLLMLSKMITHVAFFGVPAVEMLDNLCDRQYYSFPRTKSIERSSISESAIKLYNSALRKIVAHQMARGGNVMGVALSGTTDKPDREEPSKVVLARVTPGTAQMTRAPRAKLIPIAVHRLGGGVFEVVDIPRRMHTDDQLHAVMGGIAMALNERIEDKTFEYAGPKS